MRTISERLGDLFAEADLLGFNAVAILNKKSEVFQAWCAAPKKCVSFCVSLFGTIDRNDCAP
jgi:hypothetical protein